jgi:hypothetical protein
LILDLAFEETPPLGVFVLPLDAVALPLRVVLEPVRVVYRLGVLSRDVVLLLG